MIVLDILLDGLFAAIAGIGFGAISDPPMRAFPYIALLAAVGHACRFCLMTFFGVDIATVAERLSRARDSGRISSPRRRSRLKEC